MQSSATSRSTVSFQSDKLVYYASVFVYDPAQKTNFINYKASLQVFESKNCIIIQLDCLMYKFDRF